MHNELWVYMYTCPTFFPSRTPWAQRKRFWTATYSVPVAGEITYLTTLLLFLVRDDALRLWAAVETFIKDVIAIYYKSDDDVAKDNELQAWIKDIYDNGLPVREGDVDHEFPKSLQSRDQLIHMLKCVVFTCSCQHAAVNFGLMDVTGFVPFTPSLMRQPPPTKKNEATLKSIMATLPNKSQASQQIGLVYVLTRFADDEVRKKSSKIISSPYYALSRVCLLFLFCFVSCNTSQNVNISQLLNYM